jgi:hypothetical protein
MGLRIFRDLDGVCWRAWRVETPTASAHLIESNFRGGWLAFEREDGTERRRLVQGPEDWASLPEERLVSLLAVATRVELNRTGSTGSIPVVPPPDRDR